MITEINYMKFHYAATGISSAPSHLFYKGKDAGLISHQLMFQYENWW